MQFTWIINKLTKSKLSIVIVIVIIATKLIVIVIKIILKELYEKRK